MNIPIKLLTSPDDNEVVTVEILTSKPCKICLLYNPPNSGTDYQEDLLSYVSHLMKRMILLCLWVISTSQMLFGQH